MVKYSQIYSQTYSQMQHTDRYSQHSSITAKWFSVRLRTTWLRVPVALQSLKTSDIAPVSSKEFLYIQAAIESGFAIKRVRDMIRKHSQIHCTDK